MWSCPRCGDFFLGDHLVLDLKADCTLKNSTQRALLSHWIRTQYESRLPDNQGHKKPVRLDGELVKSIIKNTRPSLPEQADNYVRWIGDNVRVGGEYIAVEELAIQAIVGSETIGEFELVSGHLKDEVRFIYHGRADSDWRTVTLSWAGWERYRELKRATSESRKAFMAMQYDNEELDKIVENVFKPAVEQTGFTLFVLRDVPKAGLIDDRMRVGIRTSRFLIADLTDENRGAYWEAGYAEGLGKPVIYTCEKGKFEKAKTHFDTNHHETVEWDPKEPQQAAEKLKNTIRATLPAEAKLTDD